MTALLSLLFAPMIYAQSNPVNAPPKPPVASPATPAPSLKESVAIAILKDQRDLAAAQTQQLQIVQQYNENQTNQQTLGKSLQDKLATALKDSGLDATSFYLDPTTLKVIQKPTQPTTPTTPTVKK